MPYDASGQHQVALEDGPIDQDSWGFAQTLRLPKS
jgi:hypothetical protein